MQTELEYHDEKMKENGFVRVPSLPVDVETRRKRDIRLQALGMKLNRDSIPKAPDDEYKPVVDWEAEVARAVEESMTPPVGIGKWAHDVPCKVLDCRKEGLTRAFELLGVTARYNTRSSRAEVRHESFPEGWRTMNDRLAAELREVLTARFVYVKKVRERPISARTKSSKTTLT